ncbi:MAG: alkyl hydroperoxide reductase [Coxiella sp. RIFCSPHIGHO2_12_FULL_42_15]|nr:MAG: alkyl hydroperoxide reductase [Coxiella sp. RIFCSPHIGHO2_12_FULL_42_15]
MALTPSSMLPLGTKAPNFCLPDVLSNELVKLDAVKSTLATVVMFICNHCPYVKHILEKLLELIQTYQPLGIQFIAINSNDAHHYPQDSPEKMRELALHLNFTFPYLFDETQEIAKAYHAACTPDFFVFDKALACVYRGRFDETSPGKLNSPVTGNDLRHVLDNLLENKPINEKQFPSMGCNIKWKP